MPLGVRIMPAWSHENPRGSAHSSGAQPVGSRALPYWMSPTRALSLESANAREPARDAAMAMASDATSILRMDFCRCAAMALFMESRTGWIVGAVDVGVAGEAGAADQPLVRRRPGCEPRCRQHIVGMSCHGVALLAQHRHRRVFEQERSALLGVAGVAGLVDRVGLDQVRCQGAVRVVAIRTGHLSLR